MLQVASYKLEETLQAMLQVTSFKFQIPFDAATRNGFLSVTCKTFCSVTCNELSFVTLLPVTCSGGRI